MLPSEVWKSAQPGDKILQVRGSLRIPAAPPAHSRVNAKSKSSCSLLYPTAPEKPLGMEVREPPWAAHPRAASQPFPLVFTRGGREGKKPLRQSLNPFNWHCLGASTN